MVHMVVTTVRGNIRENREEELRRQKIIEQMQKSENIADLSAGIEVVFKNLAAEHMEQKNDEEYEQPEYVGDIEGFVYYEIPEEYQRTGGCLPEKVQKYTYSLCKQEGVRYALILAMIEAESEYKFDAVGDDGTSIGYMQVGEKWHKDRMKEVGATDLLNPYENIRVGVDYIKELQEKYGTIQDALTAYNYGESGAWEHMWSKGKYVYEYNETIMRRMKEIEGELGT